MQKVQVIATENGVLCADLPMREDKVDRYVQKLVANNGCEIRDILGRNDGYLFDCTKGLAVRVHRW